MNIATLLVRGLRTAPDGPALAQGPRVLATYEGLIDHVLGLAARLREEGVGPGDRVALFAGNQPGYIEAMLATWWCGAAVVPINAKLARPELDVILADATPSLLFVGDDTAAIADGLTAQPIASCAVGALAGRAACTRNDTTDIAPASVTPDDLAWLFFTSGTTGKPKGAMISHRNLFAAVQGYLTDVDDVPPGAAIIHFAPISHGAGLYGLAFLAQGAAQVVGETPRMDMDELFATIGAWPQACLFAPPTIVQRMTAAARAQGLHRDGSPLSNLRTIIYGGGPLYARDLAAAADTFGPRFAQIYGQGESPMTITAQSRRAFSTALAQGDAAYLATVGRPFLGIDVRIAQADGAPAPVGTVGEVVVRGASVIQGYWRNPDASAQTIRDGWLWTGDLGRMDAQGCLTLEGRSKEMIISGGSNVYPIEVEAALLEHADVREAAVLGVHDEAWGERVVAFIALHEGVEAAADTVPLLLDNHCRTRLARFKCPKEYHLRADLPKNAYGKIAKRQLAEALTR
ncbi:MAG: AMP-binding protein [Pseudomonadota bacterium]